MFVNTVVNVGTHRLHFRILPGRGPVILLESGGGDTADQWDAVAPRLATATGATVVAYDHAGFGESDLPKTEYDIRQEVAEVWRGLETLRLTQSLLLVGHSYGGFMIQLLAHDHPRAVIGCIFVEPNTTAFVDAVGGPEAVLRDLSLQLPFDTTHPEALTKEQQAIVRFLSAFPATVRLMRNVPVPPTVPIRVVTAGKPWWSTSAQNSAWRTAHDHLAAAMADGRVVVAERSGHDVPREQPDVVVELVQEMLRGRSLK